jgi:hypothetical protein
MPRKVTRNSVKDPLLDFGSDISLANDSKLPLNSDVFKRKLGIKHQENLKPTRDVCSKIFYEELRPLWERASIPVKPAKQCIDQLITLYNVFR